MNINTQKTIQVLSAQNQMMRKTIGLKQSTDNDTKARQSTEILV